MAGQGGLDRAAFGFDGRVDHPNIHNAGERKWARHEVPNFFFFFFITLEPRVE